MRDISEIKQMRRNLERAFRSSYAISITIKYETAKPNETNSNWVNGVPYQYNDVPCLKNSTGNTYFSDNIVPAITGKNVFIIPFNDDYDFSGNKKRQIKVVDIMGIVYPIDKVEADVSIGNGKYLVWKLTQK